MANSQHSLSRDQTRLSRRHCARSRRSRIEACFEMLFCLLFLVAARGMVFESFTGRSCVYRSGILGLDLSPTTVDTNVTVLSSSSTGRISCLYRQRLDLNGEPCQKPFYLFLLSLISRWQHRYKRGVLTMGRVGRLSLYEQGHSRALRASRLDSI